jgi:hypothetical protein
MWSRPVRRGSEIGRTFCSGVEGAAEKACVQNEPSGPKGPLDFAQVAARINPCPFKAAGLWAEGESRLCGTLVRFLERRRQPARTAAGIDEAAPQGAMLPWFRSGIGRRCFVAGSAVPRPGAIHNRERAYSFARRGTSANFPARFKSRRLCGNYRQSGLCLDHVCFQEIGFRRPMIALDFDWGEPFG